jgi:hypothetical protein
MLTIVALLAGAPAVDPVVQDEVIVIGRKLQAWRGVLKTKNGTVRCVTKKSTGDRDIDQIGCAAMTTCFPRFVGELNATLSPANDKATRERLNADVSRRMAACVEDSHDRLVGALADRRAARRP